MEERKTSELSDEKLNAVSGGVCPDGNANSQNEQQVTARRYCAHCKKTVIAIVYCGSRYYYTMCSNPIDDPTK